MKRIFLILFALLYTTLSYSQFALTYGSHGIRPEHTHTTQIVNNVDPGGAGKKQIWDFSDLYCKQTSVSEIVQSYYTPFGTEVENSNVAIVQNGKYFYFNVNKDKNVYHTLITDKAVIQFNEPIVKMVYPFKYGDSYKGSFTGSGLYYNRIETDVFGDYYFEADAYGTLILPNNVNIPNVLRVKTVTNTYEISCILTETKSVKYLWYVANQRYPVFAVIDNTIHRGDDVKHTITSYYTEQTYSETAQNLVESKKDIELQVYPNPVVNHFNLQYHCPDQSTVYLEIVNTNGSRVYLYAPKKKISGYQTMELSPENLKLDYGTYFIKLKINDKMYVEKLIFIK